MKIVIAVPCMDSTYTMFDQCLDALEAPKDGRFAVARNAGSLVYIARNNLIREAVKRGATHILWLDSDMVFDKDLLKKLIKDIDEQHQMVCALAHKRKKPYTPVIYNKLRIGLPGEAEVEEYEEYPKEQLFEVEGCGFGCVLMTVEMALAMLGSTEVPFSPIPGFGEDLSFCIRARQLGYKLWCDSRVKVGHLSLTVVNESTYLDYRKAHPNEEE